MASRVNVKFAVILATSLVVLSVGVGGVFAFVKLRSGDRLAAQGEKALARGDYKAADLYLSKAVNKKRTNLEWLEKWRQAREKMTPESQTVFEQEYLIYVHGILRQLAIVQRTNVEAHREFLEALLQQRIHLGSNREAWLALASEAEASLKYFEPEMPPAIRRYRGLALSAMATGVMEITEDRITVAKEDLTAVVAADPRDVQAATELISLHQFLAGRAREQNPELSRSEAEAAERVMAAMVASNPEDPVVMLNVLVREASMLAQRVAPSQNTQAQREAREAMLALSPKLASVAEMLKASDLKNLDTSALLRFLSVAVAIDPREGMALANDLTHRSLDANPNDADVLMMAAQISTFAGEFERAIQLYARVLDLPDLPIGLDGLKLFRYRTLAQIQMADSAIAIAASADASARPEAMARARRFRLELGEKAPTLTNELAFLDGKLLFLDGDLRGAQRKLDPLINGRALGSGQMAEAVAIMADIGLRIDPPQPGLTREYLRRAVAMQPWRVQYQLSLAHVELLLGQEAQAMEILQGVLERDPANEQARGQLALLRAKRDQGKVDDPVMAKLVEAERLLGGDRRVVADEPAAIRLLRNSLPGLNYDVRIVSRLVALEVTRGDTEAALTVLSEALQKHPDDQTLKNLERQVRASTSVEGAIALADATFPAGSLDRLLSHHRIYWAFGKESEATDAMRAAAKLAPEDPRVLELTFLAAIGRRDLAEASRITDVAVRTDADRAEGDTYRARLLLSQNNLREAAVLLQRSTERGNANAALFRLLGTTYLQLGRGPEAIVALRRALELNPGDANILKTTLAAMIQLGNQRDALGTARGAEAVVRRDADLRNIWLGLETAVGNAPMATEMREQILVKYPDDHVNTSALAEIYISQRNWDRSRALIDRLRRDQQDSVQLLTLDANWHAARGEWPRGRDLFIEHLMRIREDPAKLTVEPFVAMAQFLMGQGQLHLAIEALQNAIPLQDPKTLAIERAIADLYLVRGDYATAEATYRKVLTSVEDPDLRIRKRYIETLVQQGKTEEVAKEFAALGARSESDPELMCLHAENLRSRGDLRGARQVLDKAVSNFPQEPLPYYRRARMLMLDPRLMGDAMADLSSALRVREGFAAALRTRAYLNLQASRTSEAIQDLRAAVHANPSDDALLSEYIRLQLRLDRLTGAIDTAENAIKGRPNDARLAVQIGDLFAAAGSWDNAAGYYKRAWEQHRRELDAGRYAAALMEITPPRLTEAEAVLSSKELNVAKSPNLLLTRAKLRKLQRRVELARTDAVSALELTGGDPQMLLGWGEQMQRLFPEPGAAVQIIASVQAPPAMAPWLTIARHLAQAADEATRAEGIAGLRQMTTSGDVPEAKLIAVRVLSSLLATSKQWQEALEVTRAGLAMQPDDLMLLNNAAYFLAELGNGTEALPLAQKAAEGAPRQAAVLDTLAMAYRASGDRARAIQTLESAVRAQGSELERLKLLLKLGTWRLDGGDRDGARRALDSVREVLLESPWSADAVSEPLEALQKKLGAS